MGQLIVQALSGDMAAASALWFIAMPFVLVYAFIRNRRDKP